MPRCSAAFPSRPGWPLVTAGTALLGAASGLAYGLTFEAAIAAFFCWVLVIVTRTDFEHRLIPDRIVLPGAVLVATARTLDEPSLAWVLGALGAGLALFLIVLAYPKGMGMGDVKLALFMGAGLGLSVVVGLFLGFIAGAVPADRAARPPWARGSQAGDPARAVPGARRRDRALRRRRDPRLVPLVRKPLQQAPRFAQGRGLVGRFPHHVEHAPTPARVSPPVDAGLLAVAANRAASAAAEASEPPASAIAAAVEALHAAVAGLLPSVFVFEHGRLWLVAQRGYAVVPDGLSVERGVMGRAVRLGRAQLAADVRADPDFVPTLPGILTELAIPLRVGRVVVGALNIESERALPDGAANLIRPLASVLAPLAEQLRAGGALDVPALARLFVHFGSIRDPDEIAALAAASCPVCSPSRSARSSSGTRSEFPVELASWSRDASVQPPLTDRRARGSARTWPTRLSSARCSTSRAGQAARSRSRSLVWLPLRANGMELGALVAVIRADERVDPGSARRGRVARGPRGRIARCGGSRSSANGKVRLRTR